MPIGTNWGLVGPFDQTAPDGAFDGELAGLVGRELDGHGLARRNLDVDAIGLDAETVDRFVAIGVGGDAGAHAVFVVLLEPVASDRYNPVSAVHDEIDAARLAANLVSNTGHEGGDPFWRQAEQALITALVVYAAMELPARQRHLASVLRLITLGRDDTAYFGHNRPPVSVGADQ